MRLLTILLLAHAAFGQGGVTVPENTWYNPSPTFSIAGLSNVGYTGSFYDGGRKVHCLYASLKNIFTEHQTAMACYSVEANRMDVLGLGMIPATAHWSTSGHTNTNMAYVPELGCSVFDTNGSGNLIPEMLRGGPWCLDTRGLTGKNIEVQAPATIGETPVGGFVYHPTSHLLFQFTANDYRDKHTGTFDPITHDYQFYPDIGPDDAIGRQFQGNFALEVSPTDPNIILALFTGVDLWKWDMTLHSWAQITPASCTGADCVGGKPPWRLDAMFACSPEQQKCLMGGGNTVQGGGGIAYFDTWVYDVPANAWIELSPAGSYPNDVTNTTWDVLTYDPDSKLFVMHMGAAGPQVRLFRLTGQATLNVGRAPITPTVTAGSRNHAPGNWMNAPSLAVSGTTVALAAIETCDVCTSSGDKGHAFVATTPNNNTWTARPAGTQASTYAAIDSEKGGDTYSAKVLSAYSGSTLWVATEKFGTNYNNKVAVKSFNGTSWSGEEVGCFMNPCDAGSHYHQFLADFKIIAGVPHVLVRETNHNTGGHYLILAKRVGTSWVQVGANLNFSAAANSHVFWAALESDGVNPSACFTETTRDWTTRAVGYITTPQLYCKSYSAGVWTLWNGTPYNRTVSTSNSWPTEPTMSRMGGTWYVGWAERTNVGVNKIFVCQYTGSGCTTLGGSALNTNATTGYGWSPKLVNDGTNLYLSWEEQSDVGQMVRGYVKKWDGAWHPVGGAIAADPTNGSVEGMTLELVGSTPTVAFSELTYGTTRQVYTKQWDGVSTWGALGAVSSPVTVTALEVREALYPGSMSGVTRTNEPVSAGIPLADSLGITSTATLGLTGASAAQFRSLAKWPSGNIKWVKVSAIVPTVPAGGTATVTLQSNSSSTGANLATDNGATITVATGAATFTVRKAYFNVLDIVDVGATHLVLSGASAGIVLLGPDQTVAYPGNVTCSPDTGGTACTTVYASSNDAASDCSIEEPGPVMTVLKCSGALMDNATPTKHTYMKYTARLTFWQGKTSVKPVVILQNAEYGTSNTYASAYKGYQGLEIRLAANLSGALTYTFGNHTGTPSTGTVAGANGAYLYVAETDAMKADGTATSWCVGTQSCVIPSDLTGYAIVNNGSAVVTGTASDHPEGWGDIRDASGVGIQIGHNQMAGYGNKSLEFRGNGTDVRIGLWAAENNTTSLTSTAANKAYYIPWPQHDIQESFINFHASTPASLPNEFLKYQHFLVARANSMAYYVNSGVFPYFHLLDPTEEDNYYATMAAAASPSVVGQTPVAQDQGQTTYKFKMMMWRFFIWNYGGGSNQSEFRMSYLLNFIRRGWTGQYLEAASFYKLQSERSLIMSDGFDWRNKGITETEVFNFPTATSDNESLGMSHNGLDWYNHGEHAHGYGMFLYYNMTGDETIKDVLSDAYVDYILTTNDHNNPTYGKLWNARAVGIWLMNVTRTADFLEEQGDPTTAATVLARGQTPWVDQVRGDLCVSGYPAGCTPGVYNNGDTFTGARGVSYMRGIPYQYGQGLRQQGGAGCGADGRGASPFQASILIQGLNEYRIKRGSAWSDYWKIWDIMYGLSQWGMSEGHYDDGTGSWTNNAFRYYMMLDMPNDCDPNYAPSARETVMYHLWMQGQYTGTTAWKRVFDQMMAKNEYAQAWDENYHYTLGNAIYEYLHPTTVGTLQTVPITGFTNNTGGSYTISWTPPAGQQFVRMKWGTKRIVDWIGYDPGTQTPIGDPATTQNWFGSTDVTTTLTPAGTVVTGLPTNLTASNFAIKTMATATVPTTCTVSPTFLGPYSNAQAVNQTFTPSAGCGPSSCTLSGSLAGSGLSLSGCTLVGTAATGIYVFSVAYDTGSTGSIALTVNAPGVSGSPRNVTGSFRGWIYR